MGQKTQGKIFYGWYIVAAGFLIGALGICIVMNCAGLFVKPITAELGFTRQAYSMNMLINSLVRIVLAFFTGALLARFDLRKIMMLASILLPASFFMYSKATTLLQFYIISAFVGLFLGLLSFVQLAILITSWFHEKRGLAMGLAFTGSGAAGLLFSPLIAWLIETRGWRQTYVILSIIMLVGFVFCTFFIIRTKPEDMGLLPYGQSAKPQATGEERLVEGMACASALRTSTFWMWVALVLFSCACTSSSIQQINPYLSDIGYGAAFAATLSGVSMGSMALGKTGLGYLYDLIGNRKASLLAIGSIGVGFVALAFAKALPPLIYVWIVLSSVGLAFSSVAMPIVTSSLFGKKDYNRIYGYLNVGCSIGTAVGSPFMASVYDATGSYQAAWIIYAGLMAVNFVLFVLIERSAEKNGCRF